ncbi:MAG: acyltransferase family protein [Limosilactobacillus pontis]|uniref:Acetyltransferase n=1 Tax=Limosilactobacillus pontis TaxID=35787 RepID=A0A2J6NNA5_9LACO|nr:acyltransferase family protein [Limosilactobacillus pontis]PMB82783.1 acetyltransferase [Limosilactobacillus pontis]
MRKRIEWIDIARGIAILFVIIGHSLGKYTTSYFTNLIFVFHMPIFFVLSGYLYKKKHKQKFLKSSYFNLIVPYIGTVLIAFLLYTFYRFHNNNIIAPSRIFSYKDLIVSSIYGIGSVATLPVVHYKIIGIGAIWFLLAFFIGTQLFNYVMLLPIPEHGLIIKGIIIVILAFFGMYMQTYVYLPWSINAALVAQVFFFAGYIFKKFNLLGYKGKIFLLFSILLWVATATIGMFGLDNVNFPNMYIGIIGGIASSYVVMRFSMFISSNYDNYFSKGVKAVLCFYGVESLSIFCFHLVDLDYIQIWPLIMSSCSKVMPYYGSIIVGILYRIIFVTIITLIVPHIPVLRSIYMHRRYRFRIDENRML